MLKKHWDLHLFSGEYLSNVLCSLDRFGGAHAVVRLGTTGDGTMPNYQIETRDQRIAINGRSHREDVRTDEYEDDRLTAIYTYAEVEAAMAGKNKMFAIAQQQVYAYYQAHRSSLPTDIASKRDEIVALVMQGVDVAEAFNRFVDNRN